MELRKTVIFIKRLNDSKFSKFMDQWPGTKYITILMGLSLHTGLYIIPPAVTNFKMYLSVLCVYLIIELGCMSTIKLLDRFLNKTASIRIEQMDVMFPIISLIQIYTNWYKK